MSVIFTAEAEKRRLQAIKERNAQHPVKKTQWELLVTSSIVEAIHFAKASGWKDKKVQVKAYHVSSDELEYVVEPFEADCRCPNLLHYEDYIGGGEEED